MPLCRHIASAVSVVVLLGALSACDHSPAEPGTDVGGDAGPASGVGIFATVNEQQQTFTEELPIPTTTALSLGATDRVRSGALIMTVPQGGQLRGSYVCSQAGVTVQYWPPETENSSAPYLADHDHGACSITYELTGEVYEGAFAATLSPAAGGPVAFTVSGMFRLH